MMKLIVLIKQMLKDLETGFRFLLFFVLVIADIVAIQGVRLFKKGNKIINQSKNDIVCFFSGHKRQVYFYLLNRHPDCGRCGRWVE